MTTWNVYTVKKTGKSEYRIVNKFTGSKKGEPVTSQREAQQLAHAHNLNWYDEHKRRQEVLGQ